MNQLNQHLPNPYFTNDIGRTTDGYKNMQNNVEYRAVPSDFVRNDDHPLVMRRTGDGGLHIVGALTVNETTPVTAGTDFLSLSYQYKNDLSQELFLKSLQNTPFFVMVDNAGSLTMDLVEAERNPGDSGIILTNSTEWPINAIVYFNAYIAPKGQN